MIARPKMSQNEWKTTEIRASKVGNFSPFSCPGACAALEAALDASTASVDISDRRFVAEFALLDAQLTALGRDAAAVGVNILRPEFEMLGKEIRDFSGRLGVDRFDALSAFYDTLRASGDFADDDQGRANACFRFLAKERSKGEAPDEKSGNLGRFPLVLAHFWTSDHLSVRTQRVDAFLSEIASRTPTLRRR